MKEFKQFDASNESGRIKNMLRDKKFAVWAAAVCTAVFLTAAVLGLLSNLQKPDQRREQTSEVFTSVRYEELTDGEKKTILIRQLEERLQATLLALNDIQDAAVSLREEDGSASCEVMLVMQTDRVLSAELRQGIGSLIINSVPNLSEQDLLISAEAARLAAVVSN